MNAAESSGGNSQSLTFVHVFRRGLRCTMTVPDYCPVSGEVQNICCEWTGRLKRKHLDEYRRWQLVTYEFLSTRWGKRFLYALGTAPNETEIWAFEPDQAPRLLQKMPVEIP
jgi:hypothetical protein